MLISSGCSLWKKFLFPESIFLCVAQFAVQFLETEMYLCFWTEEHLGLKNNTVLQNLKPVETFAWFL